MSNNTTFDNYEDELLSQLRGKWEEGVNFLKKEKTYNDMTKNADLMEGNHRESPGSAGLSFIYDNRIRKIVSEVTSSLTDVRPIWNYDTGDDDFKRQAEILSKLARGWWKNAFADRRLNSALTWACIGGSGYLTLQWNAELAGGGDFELKPYDPRDVIPIDPVYSDSIQDWQGVILREKKSPESLKRLHPNKAYKFSAGGMLGTWGDPYTNRGKGSDVVTTVWDRLLGSKPTQSGDNTIDYLKIFYKDHSLHTGDTPKVMGDPDSNWSYTVYPLGAPMPDGEIATEIEAALYPRGRMVVCIPDAILYDGPNPYWHGQFPITKITLDALPWTILGAAVVSDLRPLQYALNNALRGLEDGVGQWVERGVIADQRAISPGNLKGIDTRMRGLKLMVNTTASSKPIEIMDGPVFPSWYMEFIDFVKNEMEEISGVKGLRDLAQLQGMPNPDTIEKHMDALTPLLRLRARAIEVSLGEIAEMLKVGFFQYYDADRRLQILGKDGLSLEDFDYDPDTLVPESLPGANREERSSRHHKNFTFQVAPNSFLNVSHTTSKLMNLQLFRAGGLDIYTMWESLDLPNIGKLPAETIPERMIYARKLGLQEGPTPEMVESQEKMAIAQAVVAEAQAAQAMAQANQGPPGGGGEPLGAPVGEIPESDNKGGMPGGGRPPSGNQPPQMVPKDGGSRVTISESGR